VNTRSHFHAHQTISNTQKGEHVFTFFFLSTQEDNFPNVYVEELSPPILLRYPPT
jgi:hypothetical protein